VILRMRKQRSKQSEGNALKTYDSGMVSLLEMRGVTVELPTAGGWVKPVNEVSLRIAAGECLGLVGESGSGKTMFSLALMGLLPPGARVNGEICLRGSEKKENSNAEAQSTQRNAEEDRGRQRKTEGGRVLRG
jgi:ABC-type glutathione transport system ATPase component